MGGFGWRCHLETGAAGGDFFGWADRTPARTLLEVGFEWGSFLVGRELSRSLKNLFWIKK
jgi:hypothetical protein